MPPRRCDCSIEITPLQFPRVSPPSLRRLLSPLAWDRLSQLGTSPWEEHHGKSILPKGVPRIQTLLSCLKQPI